MEQVWKYELPGADIVTRELPFGAKVLSVGEQNGRIMLWALVNPNAVDMVERRFRVAGTGHPVEPTLDFLFIGTVQFGNGLVFFSFFQ